ncbi:MAG TPA: hypothetical protein VGG29_10070 [Caulobacteraceae bacterium]|jgi:hypothetical protein
MSQIDLCEARDLLRDPRRVFAFYGLPILAIVGAGAAPITDVWRGAVWAAACLVMGGACLANARHCGRVHCYLTGPFAIAMGALAALHGAGVLALGPGGWNILALVLVVGSVVLTFVPELLLGKYRTGRSARA